MNALIWLAIASVLQAHSNGRFTFPWESSRLNEWCQSIHSCVNSFNVFVFFRSLDSAPADGLLLPRPRSKEALVRQLREYLHEVCFSVNLPVGIVPHQLRHTYATEMLRSGVSFPGVMKLLGHNSSDMTMKYLDIALPDLQREFHSARLHPRHLAPQPKTVAGPVRSGIKGVIDSLLATQHALAIFRRTVPNNPARRLLDRLSNRLTKILAELRNLNTPSK